MDLVSNPGNCKEGIHCRQEGSRDLVRCVVVGLELGSSSSSASWSSSLGSLTPTAGTAAVCGRRRPRIRVPHLGVRGSGRAAAFVATAAARPDRRRSVPGQAAGGGGHGRWRRCRGGWRVGSERGRAEQRWR
uniref:Uncharacterized protein n=1 Tax=Aegilops tauschii subsp. strangulata TaxID=200361 RepID=A0A453L5G1_AEGTS